MDKEQLKKLIDDSETLQKNPELREDILENLPDMSDEKMEQVAETLLQEKEKRTEIEKTYDEKMAKLNAETMSEVEELRVRAKRVARKEKENVQSQSDQEKAEDILNSI